MRRIMIILLLASALADLCIEPAIACSCLREPSPVESFKKTPVVFVGLVKSIDEALVDATRNGQTVKLRLGLTAHFFIEEALKGIKESDTEVDVVTGGNSGDCGYDFKAGERYLVYAYTGRGEERGADNAHSGDGSASSAPQSKFVVNSSICSRTRLLAKAQDDLDLIHALLKGQSLSRIFGKVDESISRLGDGLSPDDYNKPMAGLMVKAEGPAGKFQTFTDAEGRFRFDNLPTGKYKVWVVMPGGYGQRFGYGGNNDLEVKPGTWSAELYFNIKVDGRISGRVYDDQGQPITAQIPVSIITYESADKGIAAVESRHEYTEHQGQYAFDGLPPGRYILGINLADVPEKSAPYAKTYYPSGTTLSQATVLTLAQGQKLTDMDIHLSPSLETIIVECLVVKAGGTPAREATIQLYDQEQPGKNLWDTDAKTDAQGRCRIEAFKGRRYRVHAFLWDARTGTGIQSDMTDVENQNEGTLLKLTLNKPGIVQKQN